MPNVAFAFIFLGLLFSVMFIYEVTDGHKQPFALPAPQPVNIGKTVVSVPKPFVLIDFTKNKPPQNRSNRRPKA